MTEEREEYIVDNVIEHKTKLYLLAQRLKDTAAELEMLSQIEKKIVVERAEQKDSISIKGLFNA